MPQVQHARRIGAVLAADASVQEPHQQIGVLLAPAAEACIEAVDAIEVGAPDREIAGARALPGPWPELAQRTERQLQHRREPIESALHSRADPVRQSEDFDLGALAQHRFGHALRQERAVAGDKPATLGEAPVHGDEIRTRQAIAVEEHAIIAMARADRPVADLGGSEIAMLLPDMRQRRAEPRLPRLDQCRGLRPRAVVGDNHLEPPVVLLRQRTQHRVQRVGPVVGRHDDGDQFGHVPSRNAKPCYAVPRRTSAMVKRTGAG